MSESGDYTSSSEDNEDVPENERGEQGCITAKEHEGIGKIPSSSEVEKDIQCSVAVQNMHMMNREEMTEVQLLHSDQKLELGRLELPETKDNEGIISEKQTELLMTNASLLSEFQHGSELLGGTSKFTEFQYGRALREDVPEKGTLDQGCEELKHGRATVREEVPEEGTQISKKLEHGRARKENAPENCKSTKLKRKRRGKASSCLSEVQEDIKRAMDLQTMLTKDREKMSEVQPRLSKEKLELARLKQQEAKDKKEATLSEKYSELLIADTSRFNEFQKAEHERAARRIGEMLFGSDGN